MGTDEVFGTDRDAGTDGTGGDARDAGTDGDAVEPVARAGAAGQWCGQCGSALAEGDHGACARRAELEPPRWCVHCRRRMKVQVTPGAWTATCVQHGTVEQPTWG